MIDLNVTVLSKGPSIKYIRSQEGGGFVQCGQDGSVLQMRTSALFGAKNIGFFESYRVSARTRGVNFLRLYADVFYGRPRRCVK